MAAEHNSAEQKRRLKEEKPLIHCITNHISINDCANAVLALGAKPIMAEHPEEVAEITAASRALAVNTGNISDARMQSMLISGREAKARHIPCVIDAVGAACSRLRLNWITEFIRECAPSVIKGNESELRALCGMTHHTKGIDSNETSSEEAIAQIAQKAAERFQAVILISGKTDIISDGTRTAFVRNGSELMPYVTGTGCMLNAVCGAFLSVGSAFESAAAAAVTMGLAGEYAEQAFRQTGSLSQFHHSLIDALFTMDEDYYSKYERIEYHE